MRSVAVFGLAFVCVAACSGKSDGDSQSTSESGGRSAASGGQGGSAVGNGGTVDASGAPSGGESARGGRATANGGSSAGGGASSGGVTGGRDSPGLTGGRASGGAVPESGGSAGEPDAGSAGAGGPECETGEVRCLSQRERCSQAGTWEKEDYVCAIDLAGATEQNVFCAVKADGSVTCWGDEFALMTEVLPIPEGSFRRVFLADDFESINACVLDERAAATCWGPGVEQSFGAGVRDIAVGQYGLFLIDRDGRLEVRNPIPNVEGVFDGDLAGPYVRIVINDNRLLALDEEGAIHGLTSLPAGVYKDIAIGGATTCAIDADDHVVCDPAPDDSGAFAEERFVALELSEVDDACGIRVDGSVRCWDQLSGETQDAPPGEFTKLAASRGMCGLRVDGTVTCWGASVAMPPESLQ